MSLGQNSCRGECAGVIWEPNQRATKPCIRSFDHGSYCYDSILARLGIIVMAMAMMVLLVFVSVGVHV